MFHLYAGAPTIDSSKVALEDDFDPAEHDRQMAAMYDDEYYEDADEEHPFADGYTFPSLKSPPPPPPTPPPHTQTPPPHPPTPNHTHKPTR